MAFPFLKQKHNKQRSKKWRFLKLGFGAFIIFGLFGAIAATGDPHSASIYSDIKNGIFPQDADAALPVVAGYWAVGLWATAILGVFGFDQVLESIGDSLTELLIAVNQSIVFLLNHIQDFINIFLNLFYELVGLVHPYWEVVLYMCNILLVLSIAVVALLNIWGIRLDEYAIKKYLPKFIFVAIGINFSFAILMILIWLGNFLIQEIPPMVVSLINSVGSIEDTMVENYTDEITNGRPFSMEHFFDLDDAFYFKEASVDMMSKILTLIVNFVFLWALFIPYVSILFFLGARVFVLIILAITGPLAFFGYLHEQTKEITWGKWWKTLMAMVFIPVKITIFLSLMVLVVAHVPGLLMGTTGVFVTESTGGWEDWLEDPMSVRQLGFACNITRHTIFRTVLNDTMQVDCENYDTGMENAKEVSCDDEGTYFNDESCEDQRQAAIADVVWDPTSTNEKFLELILTPLISGLLYYFALRYIADNLMKNEFTDWATNVGRKIGGWIHNQGMKSPTTAWKWAKWAGNSAKKWAVWLHKFYTDPEKRATMVSKMQSKVGKELGQDKFISAHGEKVRDKLRETWHKIKDNEEITKAHLNQLSDKDFHDMGIKQTTDSQGNVKYGEYSRRKSAQSLRKDSKVKQALVSKWYVTQDQADKNQITNEHLKQLDDKDWKKLGVRRDIRTDENGKEHITYSDKTRIGDYAKYTAANLGGNKLKGAGQSLMQGNLRESYQKAFLNEKNFDIKDIQDEKKIPSVDKEKFNNYDKWETDVSVPSSTWGYIRRTLVGDYTDTEGQAQPKYKYQKYEQKGTKREKQVSESTLNQMSNEDIENALNDGSMIAHDRGEVKTTALHYGSASSQVAWVNSGSTDLYHQYLLQNNDEYREAYNKKDKNTQTSIKNEFQQKLQNEYATQKDFQKFHQEFTNTLADAWVKYEQGDHGAIDIQGQTFTNPLSEEVSDHLRQVLSLEANTLLEGHNAARDALVSKLEEGDFRGIDNKDEQKRLQEFQKALEEGIIEKTEEGFELSLKGMLSENRAKANNTLKGMDTIFNEYFSDITDNNAEETHKNLQARDYTIKTAGTNGLSNLYSPNDSNVERFLKGATSGVAGVAEWGANVGTNAARSTAGALHQAATKTVSPVAGAMLSNIVAGSSMKEAAKHIGQMISSTIKDEQWKNQREFGTQSAKIMNSTARILGEDFQKKMDFKMRDMHKNMGEYRKEAQEELEAVVKGMGLRDRLDQMGNYLKQAQKGDNKAKILLEEGFKQYIVPLANDIEDQDTIKKTYAYLNTMQEEHDRGNKVLPHDSPQGLAESLGKEAFEFANNYNPETRRFGMRQSKFTKVNGSSYNRDKLKAQAKDRDLMKHYYDEFAAKVDKNIETYGKTDKTIAKYLEESRKQIRDMFLSDDVETRAKALHLLMNDGFNRSNESDNPSIKPGSSNLTFANGAGNQITDAHEKALKTLIESGTLKWSDMLKLIDKVDQIRGAGSLQWHGYERRFSETKEGLRDTLRSEVSNTLKKNDIHAYETLDELSQPENKRLVEELGIHGEYDEAKSRLGEPTHRKEVDAWQWEVDNIVGQLDSQDNDDNDMVNTLKTAANKVAEVETRLPTDQMNADMTKRINEGVRELQKKIEDKQNEVASSLMQVFGDSIDKFGDALQSVSKIVWDNMRTSDKWKDFRQQMAISLSEATEANFDHMIRIYKEQGLLDLPEVKEALKPKIKKMIEETDTENKSRVSDLFSHAKEAWILDDDTIKEAVDGKIQAMVNEALEWVDIHSLFNTSHLAEVASDPTSKKATEMHNKIERLKELIKTFNGYMDSHNDFVQELQETLRNVRVQQASQMRPNNRRYSKNKWSS